MRKTLFLQSTLKINVSGIVRILYFPVFDEVIQRVIPERIKIRRVEENLALESLSKV